ncbi:MAG: TldD/PmbA family protein [Thermodesulfobacteriota bacterium]
MGRDILKETGAERAVDILKEKLSGRVDAYEIYVSVGSGLVAEARDGAIDSLKVRSSAGVGLRTIAGGRPGFGFSSVLTGDALSAMVDDAAAGSRAASEDKFLCLPGPQPAETPCGLLDPAIETISEEEKFKTAILIEESARGFDKRIQRVRKASYSESISSARTVNSSGVDVSHTATFFSGSVMAVAGSNGDSQMGFEIGMGHGKEDVEASLVGREAARRAVELLGAGKAETGKAPVVLENTVVMDLLGALLGSFLADNVIKGKSMLAGKLDKIVASPLLNLWDDGLLPGGWSSSAFDCEGVPRQKTPLLSQGVCRAFLYDTYWAARKGDISTGNARRSGFKGMPTIGTSNVYIEKGEGGELTELFKKMDKGFFITEFMGVHTIDPVSGDFSLGAAGFKVEGGVRTNPVRGMAVAGNLMELLKKVEAVGSDLRFIGSVGAPSILVGELDISGS